MPNPYEELLTCKECSFEERNGHSIECSKFQEEPFMHTNTELENMNYLENIRYRILEARKEGKDFIDLVCWQEKETGKNDGHRCSALHCNNCGLCQANRN